MHMLITITVIVDGIEYWPITRMNKRLKYLKIKYTTTNPRLQTPCPMLHRHFSQTIFAYREQIQDPVQFKNARWIMMNIQYELFTHY